jgi:2-methylcitrate dehydratase PrpD
MTAGSIAVPVALAFARDSDSFIRAVEAAYATGIAVAEAVGGVEALEHGVWPALFAAPAVAAVACSVALGSDEKTIAHALALAMAATSGRAGRPGGVPSGRWFVYGEAALKGMRAALAARQGFGGDLALITQAWLSQQTEAKLANLERLGALPDRAVEQVGLKPSVSARQGSNAIQAFIAVLDRGLRAAHIERVEVELPAVALSVAGRALDAGNRLSTIANVGLQLGLAAYERERLLDIGRDRPFDSRSYAFAAKVTVRAGALPEAGQYGWPATVRVYTAGGVEDQRCAVLDGDPADSGRASVVRRKLERFAPAWRDLAAPDTAGLPWPEIFERLKRIYNRLEAARPQGAERRTALTA